MKRKAVILFLAFLFTFSLFARSKSDSTAAYLDTLKAHRVHVFWQINSALTTNFILNTQVKIAPTIILGIRIGYKPNFNANGGDYGIYKTNEHSAAQGILIGVKLLRTINNGSEQQLNRGSFYWGVGFDFNDFNFPLIVFPEGARYVPFNDHKEDDPMEYVEGNYQTYTLYYIVGANSFAKWISINGYIGLGVRFKDFWATKHFFASDEFWGRSESGYVKPKDYVPDSYHALSKHYHFFSGFIMIGFNIGK